jgi:small redox-active disulfide protein 2
MEALLFGREDRTTLGGLLVANGDDIVELLTGPVEIKDTASGFALDIDPVLLEKLDHSRIENTWLNSGAYNLQSITGSLANELFGHLAACAIVNTDCGDAWFTAHWLSPLDWMNYLQKALPHQGLHLTKMFRYCTYNQITINQEESMTIQILGSGCPNCKKLEENAREAVAGLGIEAIIDHITDMDQIIEMGVLRTPGIAIDGKVQKFGKVLSPEEIAETLKAYTA